MLTAPKWRPPREEPREEGVFVVRGRGRKVGLLASCANERGGEWQRLSSAIHRGIEAHICKAFDRESGRTHRWWAGEGEKRGWLLREEHVGWHARAVEAPPCILAVEQRKSVELPHERRLLRGAAACWVEAAHGLQNWRDAVVASRIVSARDVRRSASLHRVLGPLHENYEDRSAECNVVSWTRVPPDFRTP